MSSPHSTKANLSFRAMREICFSDPLGSTRDRKTVIVLSARVLCAKGLNRCASLRNPENTSKLPLQPFCRQLRVTNHIISIFNRATL